MKCDGFESNVFYASFSHDCLLLSVGKKHSYSLYEIKSVQELNHVSFIFENVTEEFLIKQKLKIN